MTLTDRARAHADLHPESAELIRELCDHCDALTLALEVLDPPIKGCPCC